MIYYKVIKDSVLDYHTQYETVMNELVTPRERKIKFPTLSDKVFQKVEIKKSRIYWLFGVRFELI